MAKTSTDVGDATELATMCSATLQMKESRESPIGGVGKVGLRPSRLGGCVSRGTSGGQVAIMHRFPEDLLMDRPNRLVLVAIRTRPHQSNQSSYNDWPTWFSGGADPDRPYFLSEDQTILSVVVSGKTQGLPSGLCEHWITTVSLWMKGVLAAAQGRL